MPKPEASAPATALTVEDCARISLTLPLELLRWFDVHHLRQSKGKRGGKVLGSGRGGLIVEALEKFRRETEAAELRKVERLER